MKATPELIRQALGTIEISVSLEVCTKVLAIVRLLDEKGDKADLHDLSKIAAIQIDNEIDSSKAE